MVGDDQGRNWRFVKGGEITEAGGLRRNFFKIGPLNDAFSGHPKAKY